MDERERRIGLNEAMFRQVNESVRDISADYEVPEFEIVCECGDLNCTDRIQVTHAAYEALRSESHQFAVIPGHEIPDVEDVVRRCDGYDVVRKRRGVPELVAKATDPRSLR